MCLSKVVIRLKKNTYIYSIERFVIVVIRVAFFGGKRNIFH